MRKRIDKIRGEKGSHWRYFELIFGGWFVMHGGMVVVGVAMYGFIAVTQLPQLLLKQSVYLLVLSAIAAVVFDKYEALRGERVTGGISREDTSKEESDTRAA